MTKKGFTLIELLGAILIMGILTTIGIISMTKYLSKAEKEAYKTLEKTLYESAQNYTIDHIDILSNTSGYEINIETLLNEGYIDSIKDPKNKSTNCSGKIIVNNNLTSSSRLDDIKYEVKLICNKYQSENVIYPN